MTAHTDHPSRVWDRTCPACLAENPAPQVSPSIGFTTREQAEPAGAGPTPRTDAVDLKVRTEHWPDPIPGCGARLLRPHERYLRMLDFARQLERGLAAMTRAFNAEEKESHTQAKRAEKAEAALAAVTAEAKRRGMVK